LTILDKSGSCSFKSSSSSARLTATSHTSELQSRLHLVCRLLLEKKKTKQKQNSDRQQDITSMMRRVGGGGEEVLGCRGHGAASSGESEFTVLCRIEQKRWELHHL